MQAHPAGCCRPARLSAGFAEMSHPKLAHTRLPPNRGYGGLVEGALLSIRCLSLSRRPARPLVQRLWPELSTD